MQIIPRRSPFDNEQWIRPLREYDEAQKNTQGTVALHVYATHYECRYELKTIKTVRSTAVNCAADKADAQRPQDDPQAERWSGCYRLSFQIR